MSRRRRKPYARLTSTEALRSSPRLRWALVIVSGVVVACVVTFVLLWQFTAFNIYDCVQGEGGCSFSSPSSPPLSYALYNGTSAVLWTTNGAMGPPGFMEGLTNLYDGDNSTYYSGSYQVVWTWAEGLQPVNMIRLTPRAGGISFPTSFSITPAGLVFATFPALTSGNDDVLIFCFATVQATEMIFATYGNFDLAEVQAGYDPAFEVLVWQYNTDGASDVMVLGVSAGPFDPSKLVNWVPDAQSPLMASLPALNVFFNVYAAYAVWTGGTSWNMYYGGQDLGVPTENDNIYLTTTQDAFVTVGTTRQFEITWTPVVAECNNENVRRLDDGRWYMMFTAAVFQYDLGYYLNRQGYAFSPDGINWTPSIGNASFLIELLNYPLNVTLQDENGSSVPFYYQGVFHMYFVDNADPEYALQYATSTDGITYTWQHDWGVQYGAPNDMRAYLFDGTAYFLTLFHRNTQSIWYTLTATLGTEPGHPHQVLFNYSDASLDYYMVSAGAVDNGTHLMGVLYGASNTPNFTTNAIFARWLQRAVVVGDGQLRANRSRGADTAIVPIGSSRVVTDVVTIYDCDNATVLYVSPTVTMTPGDTFQLSL